MPKPAEMEMRKFSVLVFEDDIDAVLRTLGEAGIVELINIREKLEEWGGALKPYEIPTEIVNKCLSLSDRSQAIISKIDSLLKTLGELPTVEKPPVWRSPPVSMPLLKERSEDVLRDVEQKLTEVEHKFSEIEKRLPEIIASLKERHLLLDRLKSLTQVSEAVPIKKAIKEIEIQVAEKKAEVAMRLLTLKSMVELETHRISMEKQVAEAKSSLVKIREDLLTISRAIKVEREVTEAKAQLAKTATSVYFEAWVPRAKLEEASDKIKKATEGNCLIADESPSPGDKVPVAVKTPSYLTAFEKLTLAFGHPSAWEVNPIPIMAITFPILFGIMFADIGQGAIFVILGAMFAYLRRRVKLEEIGDIIRYLLVSGEMFILCGISAIFFGFIFGEFFGPSEVFHPIALGKFGPFYLGGFEPMHEPMKMLRFAILIGVVHLCLGMILKFINEIKKHHYKLLPVPVCWMWLLLGGLFMWMHWGGITGISKWFAEGILMLVGFVILPLIGIIVSMGIAEGFMEGIGFGVEVFAETLSHTMSYCRLMALGLIHSAMNYLFLVLGGVEHGYFPLMSIPIIAVGTILVMIIEGLVVFVHTLRLHWVEWFSKFYSGEGIPFKPFKFI